MKKLTWEEKALAATRGSQFGAIVACALDKKIPAPYFSGKASVTSDGFVMCNFTDADGRGHMGAFVGDFGSVLRNTRGLANHLKLEGKDRKELFAVIENWIAEDWSGKAKQQLAA